MPCVALLACLLPALVRAAPWDLAVEADIGIIHTNNIFLDAADAEENDTVYSLSPLFTLESQGERMDAQIRYKPEAFFYSEFNEADEVFHQAEASLQTDLVRERLSLQLNGARFQSIVSPEGAFPTSNLPITGNRIDSTTLGARPSWQQRLGSADLRVQAGWQYLDYDGSGFQSSEEWDALVSLDNHAQQQGLAWGVNYSFRRLEYEISTPFEFQRAELNLGFWANSALRIFAGGGAETSFDDIFDPNLDDDFWEVGFQLNPNARFGMELAVGERSYGTSARGNLNYKLRRGSLTASYSEVPSTRAETVFSGSRLTIDDTSLEGILDRPGNADRFVRKRGDVRLNVDLNKSEISLRVFTEARENRTTEEGVALAEESLSGFSAGWAWQFGSRTRLSLDGDVARRDDGVGDRDITRFNIGVAYQVSPRTSLSLALARTEQDGDTGRNASYTENQGRLLLKVTLL